MRLNGDKMKHKRELQIPEIEQLEAELKRERYRHRVLHSFTY